MSVSSQGNFFPVPHLSRTPGDECSGTFRISDTTIGSSRHSLLPSPSVLTVNSGVSAISDDSENMPTMEATLKSQKSKLIEIIFAHNSVTERERLEGETNRRDELLDYLPSPPSCNSKNWKENVSEEKTAKQSSKQEINTLKPEKKLLHDLTNLPSSYNSSVKKCQKVGKVLHSQKNLPNLQEGEAQHLDLPTKEHPELQELTNYSYERQMQTTEASSDFEDQGCSPKRTTLNICDLQKTSSIVHEKLQNKSDGFQLINGNPKIATRVCQKKAYTTLKSNGPRRNEGYCDISEQLRVQSEHRELRNKRNQIELNSRLSSTCGVSFDSHSKLHFHCLKPSPLSLHSSHNVVTNSTHKSIKNTNKTKKSVSLEKFQDNNNRRSSEISFCVNNSNFPKEGLLQIDQVFGQTAHFSTSGSNKLKRDLQIIVNKLQEKTDRDQQTILELRQKRDQGIQRKRELGTRLSELTFGCHVNRFVFSQQAYDYYLVENC